MLWCGGTFILKIAAIYINLLYLWLANNKTCYMQYITHSIFILYIRVLHNTQSLCHSEPHIYKHSNTLSLYLRVPQVWCIFDRQRHTNSLLQGYLSVDKILHYFVHHEDMKIGLDRLATTLLLSHISINFNFYPFLRLKISHFAVNFIQTIRDARLSDHDV